uniref:Uncharacterized protein n=1 Tax=Meloidogyne javanica TaxID=6303 RepID=A0A915LGK3_MELJA
MFFHKHFVYEKQNIYDDSYSNNYQVKYGQGRRIIDDYICDLDASVLVVTSDNGYKKAGYEAKQPSYPAGYEKIKRAKRSEYADQEYKKYGEYGHSSYNKYKVAKAHRLRCSIIASGSDEDCRKCCHMAARKERSIAKDTIFGFVVDYDEVNPTQYTPPAASYLHKPPYRSKRDAASSTDYYTTAPPEYKKEEEYKQPASEYASPGYSPATNYQNYYNYEKTPTNPRCVCCSPRVYSVHRDYGKKKSYGSEYKKGGEYGGEYKKGGEYGNEEYGGAKQGYEAPKYEAPKYEAPKGGYEAPKYEAPKYEAPKYEAPKGGYEAPKGGYEAQYGGYEGPQYGPPQGEYGAQGGYEGEGIKE